MHLRSARLSLRARPTTHTPALLALSLAVHITGLYALVSLGGSGSRAMADDVGFVELVGADAPAGTISAATPLAPPPGDRAVPGDRSEAAAPPPSPAVDVAALEAARDELQDQVAALAAENADLAARLDAERDRAAEMERQLHDARTAEQSRVAQLRSDYDALVAALRQELADRSVALERGNGRLTVTIPDRVLFPSGQATLTPEGRIVMSRVGQILARIDDRRILIEGHTDDVPIGPDLRTRFASNWELSAARATEVVRYLTREGGVPQDHLSAAGRAATDPVASNASEEGRRRNRRIEIILLPLEGRPSGG